MSVNSKSSSSVRKANHRGFTLLQLIVVVALITVVSAFGFLGIRNVRAEMRLQNSARRFAIYLEKARLDSVRRRVSPGAEAQVQTFDPGTSNFLVTMDFDGNGTVESQAFVLDDGISFGTNAQTIAFDWRGRITQRAVFGITNGSKTIPVDVSGAGDVTLGDQRFADDSIGEVVLAGVPPDVVPDPTPFPIVSSPSDPPPSDPPVADPTPTPPGNGNGNGNGGDGGDNGNGNPHASPTPTPTPTPEPTPTPTPDPGAPPQPCASSVSPRSLTLSQRASSQRFGNVLFTLTNATGTNRITAVQAGAGRNLSIAVSPTSLSGNGTATVTITSLSGSGNRGSFTVNISSPTCGSTQAVTVTVNN
jgi:Tfp pilus assembly protein FimT